MKQAFLPITLCRLLQNYFRNIIFFCNESQNMVINKQNPQKIQRKENGPMQSPQKKKKASTPDMAEIYRAHARTVYRYLLSLCRNAFVAEELTQETFYQAVRSLNRYDETCKITTWLCAIAKNQWMVYLKRHPAMLEYNEKISDMYSPSAEDTVISRQNRQEIIKLLHTFPEPVREVLCLRLSADLSFREIGDILNRSENWARVTYYRGKEALLKKIKKTGGNYE